MPLELKRCILVGMQIDSDLNADAAACPVLWIHEDIFTYFGSLPQSTIYS